MNDSFTQYASLLVALYLCLHLSLGVIPHNHMIDGRVYIRHKKEARHSHRLLKLSLMSSVPSTYSCCSIRDISKQFEVPANTLH